MGFAQRAKKAVGWLMTPPVERVPRWWLHCPICDAELVGPYPAGQIIPVGTSGPSMIDPTRDELVAKCPVHGHLPYNGNSLPSPRRRPFKER